MAKLIPIRREKYRRSLQPVDLPTRPVREAIFEAWLDCRPGEEIERMLGVSPEQIRRVLWAYAQINERKQRVTRSYQPEVEFLYREIEYAVWQEVKGGPPMPPPARAMKLVA